ncbi:MAG: hypothetical protein LVQ96_07080 [Thermoplasmatales archaeon]|nr:hypothetical protein [Thermoplasmatales archaeon]MCW6170918.1 hypothetical protein [Thermoplasmatales archaeon]
MDINLWNPQYEGIYAAFLVSYLLGIVHGITPDEHTWPITFSYAVGSYSVKGGAKAGLIFSSGFTLERAIMSEIAAIALTGFMFYPYFNSLIYVIVGTVMAISGLYISKKLHYPHIHVIEHAFYSLFGIHKHRALEEEEEFEHIKNPILREDHGIYKPIPMKLAFVHGLIAGFGFGAFALIIYFVLAPSMPIYIGFMPGLLFGLGTMTMQVLAGTIFGMWLSKAKKLSLQGIQTVARGMSSYVLTYGGSAFVIAGIVTIIFPALWNYGIDTGLKVHNLDVLGLPFFIVVFSVAVIGVIAYEINMHKAIELEKEERITGANREIINKAS